MFGRNLSICPAIFMLCITGGCARPNYFPPVPVGYYVKDEKNLRANGGLSLSGLYFSSSINLREHFLLTPNISGSPWEGDLRVGMGVGKIFSLLDTKLISLSFIPSVFLNSIGFKGERLISSPSLSGVEFFPDLQFSLYADSLGIVIELYAGTQLIFIPYAKVRWEKDKTTELYQEFEETYSDPFQLILPSIYGGIQLGSRVVAINFGVLFLVPILKEFHPQSGAEPADVKLELKDRFVPSEGTVSLGLVINF